MGLDHLELQDRKDTDCTKATIAMSGGLELLSFVLCNHTNTKGSYRVKKRRSQSRISMGSMRHLAYTKCEPPLHY